MSKGRTISNAAALSCIATSVTIRGTTRSSQGLCHAKKISSVHLRVSRVGDGMFCLGWAGLTACRAYNYKATATFPVRFGYRLLKMALRVYLPNIPSGYCYIFSFSNVVRGSIDPTLVPVVKVDVRMALPSKLSSFLVTAALDSTHIFCICSYSRVQYSSFGFSFGDFCSVFFTSL